MTDEDGKNRRVFPRAQKSTPAWFMVDGKYVRCQAIDLGVGGACLVTDGPLPEEEIEVCFELASDWSVRAMARPVWQKPADDKKYMVGVTYRPLRSSDKHLIGPWVHKARREALRGMRT